MADEKRINEEIQEEVTISEEMKPKKIEVLRITVTMVDPEKDEEYDLELRFDERIEEAEIAGILTELCEKQFGLICIPKEVLKSTNNLVVLHSFGGDESDEDECAE